MKKKFFVFGFLTFLFYSSIYFLKKHDPILQFSPKVSKLEILEIADKDAQKFGIKEYRRKIIFHTNKDYVSYVSRKLKSSQLDEFYEKYGIAPNYWVVEYFDKSSFEQLFLAYTIKGELKGYRKTSLQDEYINLSEKKAREVGIKELKNLKGLCFREEEYEEIEYKFEKKISGMIDHSFIFESKYELGAAKQKILLTVSGSNVSFVITDIKIPKNFESEYGKIREKNNVAFNLSQLLIYFSYIPLIIFFVRYSLKRKIALKFSLIASLIILLGEIDFNFYENYSPTTSLTLYILNYLVGELSNKFIFFSRVFITITTVIALDEELFPKHINFRSLFNRRSLASNEYFSLILKSYLIAALLLFSTSIFYKIAISYFGWHSKISIITPDMFNNFLASFQYIFSSIKCGLWEEYLFRGFSISIAIILYRRYQKKSILIFFFLLQTLVFNLAHTNYYATPFYFRVIELIPLSFTLAFAFYTNGLILPVIVHSVYNLFSSSLGFFNNLKMFKLEAVLITIALALPILLHIFFKYYKKIEGKLLINQEVELEKGLEISFPIKKQTNSFVITLVLLLPLTFCFKSSIPNIDLVKVEKLALQFMKDKNFHISKTYITLQKENVYLIDLLNRRDDKLWKDTYAEMQNFTILFISKDLDEKIQHYVRMDLNYKIFEYYSFYPEGIAFPKLKESQAREIALKEIERHYDVSNPSLTSSHEKENGSWYLTFKIHDDIEVECFIANNKVASLSKFFIIPEELKLKANKTLIYFELIESFSKLVIKIVEVVVIMFLVLNFRIVVRRSYLLAISLSLILGILSIFNFNKFNQNSIYLYENRVTHFYNFLSSNLLDIIFNLLIILFLILQIESFNLRIESFKLRDKIDRSKLILSLIFPIAAIFSLYVSRQNVDLSLFSADFVTLSYLTEAVNSFFLDSVRLLGVVMVSKYFDKKYISFILFFFYTLIVTKYILTLKIFISFLIYLLGLYVSYIYLWQNMPLTLLLSLFFLFTLKNISLLFTNLLLGHILSILILGLLLYLLFNEQDNKSQIKND